jgi:hypothetical protein
VAVHVAPGLKPVIVVENGVASDAGPDAGEGVPVVQVTLTVTLAPLFGTKSLFTVSVALLSVLMIVQETFPPRTSVLLTQPDWFAVYPAGTVSVAVQVAPGVNPVTVVTNGVASDADPLAGEGRPLVHVTLTLTLAPSFGTKSLFTVNVALFSVLTMVHEAAPPTLMGTLAQPAWFVV